MDWNLEGHTVEGLYLGDYPVRGTVELSRVAFGGEVHHSVRLDRPLVLPWSTLKGDPRTHVILEHRCITAVLETVAE